MAKSLRSKKKQENKINKRQGVFGDVAAAREKRIAERLHNAAIDQILANQEQPTAVPDEAGGVQEDAMEVEITQKQENSESVASTKKSTGGWGRKRKTRGKKSRKSRK